MGGVFFMLLVVGRGGELVVSLFGFLVVVNWLDCGVFVKGVLEVFIVIRISI